MADKNIGALPQAAQLDDSSLLVAEQQGQAVKITGAQFKEFGRQAVVGQVQGYVDQAEAAANRAEGAVRSVEDMTMEAAALPAGQEAAVTKTIRAGKVHLAFGLPRGEQGVPGPEGKQGQRGPKGDPGTGLKILGYYDTLPALEAAAAAPSAGDAYGIGTEPPTAFTSSMVRLIPGRTTGSCPGAAAVSCRNMWSPRKAARLLRSRQAWERAPTPSPLWTRRSPP